MNRPAAAPLNAFAPLRSAVAEWPTAWWNRAAVEMIVAALLALLDKLDLLFAAWRDGTLPAPPDPLQTPARPAQARPMPSPRQASRQTGPRAPRPATRRPAVPAPSTAARPAPRNAVAPATSPASRTAAAAPFRFFSTPAEAQTHALIITLSKQ